MWARRQLGTKRISCLLHSLEPGGSTYQWVRLLGHHVAAGGEATILAPHGPGAAVAEAAGVEVVATEWETEEAAGWSCVSDAAARAGFVVVHWDHVVMHAYGPALEACGRAALVAHQPPHQLLRWFPPEVMAGAQEVFERAAAQRSGFVFVRGAAHRRQFEEAFAIPPRALRVLPPSIPLPPFAGGAGDEDILALTRHSPEKAAIPELAVELTRRGLERGHSCRLAVVGNGPGRDWVEALCADRLPPGSWQFEDAPADAIARLAVADIVVAQGTTTLESAALGRRVVVAHHDAGGGHAGGIVLRPETYEDAARDPFGEPQLAADLDSVWDGLLSVDESELRELRVLVEANHSLDAAASAARAAITATPGAVGFRRSIRTGFERLGR
jgi:hypothetical protein